MYFCHTQELDNHSSPYKLQDIFEEEESNDAAEDRNKYFCHMQEIYSHSRSDKFSGKMKEENNGEFEDYSKYSCHMQKHCTVRYYGKSLGIFEVG